MFKVLTCGGIEEDGEVEGDGGSVEDVGKDVEVGSGVGSELLKYIVFYEKAKYI